ncbi:iron ABC transporter substrate-binding protein [Methylopila sp. M107]|uniref:iron ABC transporter substrate-binding protein n=1 Tax=Methylopila sp. M107 TaxID=1101190 RepID=UPI000376C345|nr:iron ABC transporter substrate-binding protein [Methylopila sp. M107]
MRVPGLSLVAVLALFCALVCSPLASAKPFVDSAGRTVGVSDTLKRVLAAGPPASVLLYALAPDLMAGWVRAPSEAEKPYLLAETRELPTYGRLTGRGGTANIEAVLAAKPDLIVDVGSVDPTYVSLADRVQQQTGIPYVLIDGALAKSPEALRALGAVLGRETRAQELASYAAETLDATAQGVAKLPEAGRPRVYYARGPDGLETAPKGSITVETLDAVGAVNVAEGGKGLSRVSTEQILGWNPQVVVTLDPGFRARVANDPVWSGIAAVRDGRIYAAPTAPFGWLDAPPGVNRLIGLRWLASALYPKTFADDLRAEARRFYKLFYQVDLDEAQLDALLKDAVAKAP